MPAPATVADFLALVHKSGLLDQPQLDGYLSRLGQAAAVPADPGQLAGLLVRDGLLTAFQAEQLLRGKSHGFVLGKYRILEPLGAGGMAVVYLCQHLRMGRPVALKVLPPDRASDPASLGRFFREAQAVAALDHLNIVRAFDVDVFGKIYFLVMEYIEGVNLQDLIARGGPLNPTRAAHYVAQAADGLQHAHRAGLVHRDIKPSNLLLNRAGVVKILDMGLARFFREHNDSLTREHDAQTVLGTADYLAPEQARDSHDVDIRADVYSLGATFYYLLTGKAPFAEGSLNQKLIWHQMRTPAPPHVLRPEVPAALSAVVARMMAKDARDRYQTPADVVLALSPWTRHPIAPPSPDQLPPPRQSLYGHRPGPATPAGPVTAALNPASFPAGPPSTLTESARETPTGVVGSGPADLTPESSIKLHPERNDPIWALIDEEGSGVPGSEPAAARTCAHAGVQASGPGSGRRGRVRSPRRRLPLWTGMAFLLGVGLLGVVIWWAVKGHGDRPARASNPLQPPRGTRALALDNGQIELTWDYPYDRSVLTGFKIERAVNELRFSDEPLAITPADVTRYTDAPPTPGAGCYYRLFATGPAGDSAFSRIVSAPPNFGGGFKPPPGTKAPVLPPSLSLNGGATVLDGILRVTDGNKNVTRSAFYRTLVDVRSFTTTFTFRVSGGRTASLVSALGMTFSRPNPWLVSWAAETMVRTGGEKSADGITFCIQGNDPTRIGGGGGGLGYEGIPRSVAVKFDLADNQGKASNSTGVYTNGAGPYNPGSLDLTPSGINLRSGRVYRVELGYEGGKLSLHVADVADVKKSYRQTVSVDVPKVVGSPFAYAGFTGASGGEGAVQDVLSWMWTQGEGP